MIINNKISTDVHTFEILMEGEKISGTYHVKSIVVSKEVNRIATARIILFDGGDINEGFEISNSNDFIPGNKIEIKAGYHSKNASIFKGIVIKQNIKRASGRFELIVDCKHPAVNMTINKNSRYFYKIKDSEIIEELVQPYAISVQTEPTTVKHEEMVQYQISDWEFIVMRAELNGQLIFTNNDEMKVAAPDFEQEPTLTLSIDSIMEIEMEMDARNQLKSVSSCAWDPSLQKVTTAEAILPKLNDQGNMDAEKLADVTTHKEYQIAHTGNVKDLELQAWADSKLLKSRLAKIRGRIKYQGDAAIQTGDLAELKGIGKRFDGDVYITGVRHQINTKNWETDIQFGLSPEWHHESNTCKNKNGLISYTAGLQTGVVVQIQDDPEGEDRILIRSPLVSEDEPGIWARVNCVDAGDNRGVFFRPEIDDEVVLGFINNDPRHPVVLGMLNSSSKPAPLKASDTNPEKGFVTRNGLKFIFDDELEQMTLETPAGNTLTISDDNGGILIEDSNKNSIEMNEDGIKIESGSDLNISAKGDINIEGINIAQNASAEYKAEGASGAEMTTGAIAVLKGSLVKIN